MLQLGYCQGTETPAWGSQEKTLKCCPNSLQESEATYPQVSHELSTDLHMTSRTRMHSKFITPIHHMYQVQGVRARSVQLPTNACSTFGAGADVTEQLVQCFGHSGLGG